MQDEIAFRPDRRLGLIFHTISIVLLALAGTFSLWQASQASIAPAFMLYLLPLLAAAVAVPLLAYRAFALQNALYTLERDGIHLRWGLRSEDIPINNILWVHPVADLSAPLSLPRLRWPGALLGTRRIPGGEIEFLAAGTRGLLLIATETGGFAISPAEPQKLLEAYQRYTEMGSLAPAAARSVYPSFLLERIWSSIPARSLLLACVGLSVALLLWVVLAIPGRSEVHLVFRPDGSLGDLVPSRALVLLPVLNFSFLIVGVSLGLLFFRRKETQPISYLLWSSGVLTSLLYLLAVFFIL
jgi:hypothetical protein